MTNTKITIFITLPLVPNEIFGYTYPGSAYFLFTYVNMEKGKTREKGKRKSMPYTSVKI